MNKVQVFTSGAERGKTTATDYEYDISVDGNTVEMHRSTAADWTRPGEQVVISEEDVMKGEYKITLGDKKIKINYAEAYELFILLGIVQDMGVIEYRESKVIKSYGK